MWLGSLITGAVSTVSRFFHQREERKQTRIITESKLIEAKQKGEHDITLTDAEWESISAKGQGESWKDEYITLVITSPIVLLLAGGLWLTFTGDDRLLTGVDRGIEALRSIGVNMGLMMEAVVFAAIGLKFWRGR